MKYNCTTCMYSNPLENGDVLCDKRKLQGVDVIISSGKVNLSCPAHSHYPREEIRYGMNNKLHIEADDVCDICHRDLDLLDTYNWRWVKVVDRDGRESIIKKCKICEEKGR